ncbi:hypothetical protein SAMN05421823_1291, partial [Catalinimonas alkaloidigena]
GSVGGLWTKIIAFLACLISASLPITGLIIWLGKKKKKPRNAQGRGTRAKRSGGRLSPKQPTPAAVAEQVNASKG